MEDSGEVSESFKQAFRLSLFKECPANIVLKKIREHPEQIVLTLKDTFPF